MQYLKFYLALMCAIVCCPAMMAEDVVIDGLKYALDRAAGTARVIRNVESGKSTYSGAVVVPSSVDYEGSSYAVVALGDSCFYGSNELTSVDLPESVSSLGKACFSGCATLSDVRLPGGLTSLPEQCFSGCYRLAGLALPEGLTSLGSHCFSGCQSLSDITLPAGLTSLGEQCFNGCRALSSVNVPQGVTALPYRCFNDCLNLTDVTLPEGLTSLGDESFRYAGFKRIDFPQSLTSIGQRCFVGCENLASVRWPEAITHIPAGCFFGCYGLTYLNLPEGVTFVGDQSFAWCTNLATVDLPKSLTTLIFYSFYNCDALTSIVLPEGVTEIGGGCFDECDNLQVLAIKAKTPPTEFSGFYHCNLAKVYVPGESLDQYKEQIGPSLPDAVTIYPFIEQIVVEPEISLSRGEEHTLDFQLLPEGADPEAVRFNCWYWNSETDVISLSDDHRIKALANGWAGIRIEAADSGSDVSAICYVSVSDQTGIRAVDHDGADAAYYTLSGLRVSGRPQQSGVYIRVKDGRSQKFVVRH